MTREEAAQILVGRLASVTGMHRSMDRSKVKDVVIEALTDFAVDLILEKSALETENITLKTRFDAYREALGSLS